MKVQTKMYILEQYVADHVSRYHNGADALVDASAVEHDTIRFEVSVYEDDSVYMDPWAHIATYDLPLASITKCHPEFLPMLGENTGAQIISEYEKSSPDDGIALTQSDMDMLLFESPFRIGDNDYHNRKQEQIIRCTIQAFREVVDTGNKLPDGNQFDDYENKQLAFQTDEVLLFVHEAGPHIPGSYSFHNFHLPYTAIDGIIPKGRDINE